MKKKIISLALCAAMAISMTACSAGGTKETTAAATEAAAESSAVQETKAEEVKEEAKETEEEKSASASETKAENTETREFTDDVGRTVTVPKEIKKVAISGPLAQIVMYGFAPETLVGFSSAWSEDSSTYIPEEYRKLPVLGQLYGGKGELNLEEILAVDPDIILDIGEQKKDMASDLDALQEQIGVPFIHIDCYTETAGDTFRKIGDLLNLQERGEEYGKYCDDAYARAKGIMDKVGDNRKTVLYVTGDEGLNVIAKDSFHAEILDMMTDNLAKLDDPSSKGTGNEVDMEQILKWNPETIIFAPQSIYSSVAEMPEWKDVKAIRDGNYYEVPYGPYNWMGFPPSIQRYLGMMWMASLLYPEDVDYDLKEEVQNYYKMFYHTELSDEQYEKLVANSIGKLAAENKAETTEDKTTEEKPAQ